MKKFLSLLLVVAVIASLAIGGTTAYLTDDDSDVNVTTLGNIKIKQIELQRKDGIDYKNGGKVCEGNELEPFEQGQPLFPAYTDDTSDYSAKTSDDEQFWWGPYVTADVTHEKGSASNGLFDDGLQGAIDKFVFVENTGRSSAYYRTWLAFECPECLRYDGNTVAKADLWINTNSNSRFEWSEGDFVTIGGVRYLVFCATYLQELPKGEISRPSLLQVALTSTADNEDIKALGDTYEILAYSQAVQVNNMPDAKTALTTAFGEPVAENHPWKDDPKVEYIEEATELEEALASGDIIVAKENTEVILETEEAISLNGNGSTVIVNGDGAESGRYGYLGFVPPAGESVDVSNLNVTGSGFVELGHYGYGGGNYTATNLKVEDLEATLSSKDASNTVGIAFSHYGNAVLTDCVMTGTTALKPDTVPYDAGFVHDTTTLIKGGEYGRIYMWNRATVTIEGAEVDYIAASQFIRSGYDAKLVVGNGTHIGTLQIICGDTRTPAIVIEDGAVIDEIIHKGVSYTQAEWLAL